MPRQKVYISRSHLKTNRKWPEELIQRFFPEIGQREKFDLKRVEKIESSIRFQKALVSINTPKITLINLKQTRKWTKALIEEFYPYPDLVQNPHYKNAAPMKLFDLKTVKRIERSKAFKEKLEQKKAFREKISSKNAEKKREELRDYIKTLIIEIPYFMKKDLHKKAFESYQDLWSSRGDFDKAFMDSKELNNLFLERISVNFLRHCCSEYEEKIIFLYGRVGKDEGIALLKNRILKQISKVYPYLSVECNRQKRGICGSGN